MFTTLLLMALNGLLTPSVSIGDTIHHFNQLAEQHLATAPDSSLYDAQQAYQLAKAYHDQQRIGYAAFQLGTVHYTQKRYDQAMQHFEEAKAIAKQIQDAALAAKALDKMASIYLKTNNLSQALPLQQRALQYAYTAQQPELLISLLRNSGNTYWLLQEYDSALYYYQQRIPLCNEQENIQKLIEAHTDVATVLFRLRKFDACVFHYEKSINLIKQTNDTSQLANAYTYLANAYRLLGAHQKAYYAIHNSIPFLQEPQKQKELAAAYSTLGTISLQLTNLEEAVQFFEQSLRIRNTVNDDYNLANSLINLGMAYYYLKDYQQARAYFFKAQKVIDKNSFIEISAYTHDNLGRVYLALQQKDSALYHYRKALQIRQSIARPPHPNLADVHTELAKTYLSLEEYKQVENHIQESTYALGVLEKDDFLSIYKIPPGNASISGEEYLDLMRLKGDYLSTAFDDTTAWKAGLQHYETGIQFLLRSYVFARELDQSKLAWLTSYRPMFESAIALAHRLYEATHHISYIERAFALVEQNKALLLRQSLRESLAKASVSLPDSLMATEQSLRQAISQTETDLLKIDKTQDSTQYWQLKTALTQVREQYFQWVEKVEAAYPEYYTLKYDIHTISLKEIQQQLPSNTLMVNYFLGEKYLYGFGVRPDTIICNKYALPADWHIRLQTYYRALTDYNYLIDSSEVVQHIIAKQGYEFYQTLVSPFLENPKENIKKFIVVPDGALNLLPFSVLLTDRPQALHYGTFPYLLKKLSVQYTYSANLYFQSIPEHLQSDKPYDFGGFSADYRVNDPKDTTKYLPLPGAQQLVEEAANLMGGNAWKNTTKATFLTFAPQCKIVHFGGHAIAGNTNLANNCLVFHADPPQERYLYLPEIYNLDLHGTDLVVLSGCNTGIGEIKSGEGLISVARAFQYAGTQNLLLALNVISDAETRQLLQSFYTHLDDDFSIEESLRRAKLEYLEDHNDDPLLSHPLYWASIITFGRGGAMTEDALLYESSIFPLAVVTIVLLAFLLIWFFREKTVVKKVLQSFL